MFEKVELNSRVTLYKGDNALILPQLEDNSIDAIITDPPAGIAFMGKDWDKNKGGRDTWIAWMQEVATQCLRIIKPGGHALIWAIPRTSHWTATAWEDAGWEIRDKVYHAFASGFPKGLNIGKAIDRHLGAEREIVGENRWIHVMGNRPKDDTTQIYGRGQTDNRYDTAPATKQAQEFDGWNTTLKPAIEEWIMFRKPTRGTIVENVLQYGVGGINIDACRVPTQEYLGRPKGQEVNAYNRSQHPEPMLGKITSEPEARYPSTLIHDGSDEVVSLFPDSKGQQGNVRGTEPSRTGVNTNCYGEYGRIAAQKRSDSGSAARFFYCAKASKRDRDEGLEEFPEVRVGALQANVDDNDSFLTSGGNPRRATGHNHHATVKPTSLMQYLCRLITPPDGIILDPFMGSGSTGKAAMLEGFRFIGIEQEQDYFDIAQARILWVYNKEKQGRLF